MVCLKRANEREEFEFEFLVQSTWIEYEMTFFCYWINRSISALLICGFEMTRYKMSFYNISQVLLFEENLQSSHHHVLLN